MLLIERSQLLSLLYVLVGLVMRKGYTSVDNSFARSTSYHEARSASYGVVNRDFGQALESSYRHEQLSLGSYIQPDVCMYVYISTTIKCSSEANR